MPKHVQGIADDRLVRDQRTLIDPDEEQRLVAAAVAAGISDSSIGSFFVILVAGIPVDITAEGYDIFDEDELREAAEQQDTWFYDEDKRRLMGTIPTAAEIVANMRKGKQ